MLSNCSCLQSNAIIQLESKIKKEEVAVQTNAGEPVKIIANVECCDVIRRT